MTSNEDNANKGVDIEQSWYEVLQHFFSSTQFTALKQFLVEEKKRFNVFPEGKDIFHAFRRTPYHEVKVVMLGQDPYHGAGQAHGLCFSVKDGVPIPPSLRNIFKEMCQEFDVPMPTTGNLGHLADQGVLLLNATLTVREGQAGSHQGQGWEMFTDEVIRSLNNTPQHIIFLLWGRFAQQKAQLIDQRKHYVLTAPHPSPLSASRGFFGCGHFKEANKILMASGNQPINWLPE